MWLSLILLSLSALLPEKLLLNLLAPLALKAHRFCQSQTPQNSDWKESYDAIVCGADLPRDEFSEILIVSGLYHLIVVSGSHLIFLDSLLRPFVMKLGRSSQLVIFSLLLIYAFLCNLCPPAVRALITLVLHRTNETHKLNWNPIYVTLISGLLNLAIFPSWWNSLSFQMSWVAALAISVTSSASQGSPLRAHFIIYIMILPAILPLQMPHPASILFNWILGPGIGMILFPISILACIVKPISPLVDLIWEALGFILQHLTANLELQDSSFKNHWIWYYILTLHIYFIFEHKLGLKKKWADYHDYLRRQNRMENYRAENQ